MAMNPEGFFRTPTKPEYSSVIYVGGGQFQAAAVALMDYWQSHPTLNENTKKILLRLGEHFPKYALTTTLKTDDLRRLLNNPRRSELVESLAYVLRQLAVDELYADYLNLDYREVFAGLSASTPKSLLRDPNTILPACALKALARAIKIPITLSYKEPGKELRLREEVANGS